MAKELKVALVCLASHRASVRSGTINVRSRPICVTAATLRATRISIMMIYRDEVYDDKTTGAGSCRADHQEGTKRLSGNGENEMARRAHKLCGLVTHL